MSVALLFPGQGSQRAGMLASLDGSEAARNVFARARAVLGYDPRSFDDERAYRSTVHAQINLLLYGAVCAERLECEGVRPAIVAGHSIGAFSAAIAANAIALEPATRAVHARALAMERLYPAGYGMGVCAGLPISTVRQIVQRAHANGARAYLANVNAATQTVIAGKLDALDDVLAACAAHGARRAERLAVSVPSHCELLQPVTDVLRAAIAEDDCANPQCIDISGMTGSAMRSAAQIRDDLCDGVAREVRWIDVARVIEELAVALTIECGPGRVLTDLFESSSPSRHEAIDGMAFTSAVALAKRAR